MRIWVDADACPNPVKEILFRAADRMKVALTLVANKPLRTPRSAYINTIQVAAGFDVADDKIAAELSAGDLVITADIPLAAAVIKKGGRVLDPRGDMYNEDNIEARLTLRTFMDELRVGGIDTGGPEPFNHGDRQAFARQLDRLLARQGSAEFAPKQRAPGA
jgi:uncharacterized protein YaiI (UPF0178 family)